ncbi:cupin domain-containing protein [Bordetella avium]|nr:cupin domain-containing protein [Bordetella avium]RIQ16707.1 cupin domain-containing protein [Bordetella avium]RIQ35041.1 cupin domain-containing protein [Bordetella avium]RIQ49388.1 cupin domain-containing protein [Bordetella avium]RIQ74739.1 cupin domain-containing protein [Bordetella avium]
MSSSSEAIRRQWREAGLAPLWESPNAHKEQDGAVPSHIWRWEQTRPLIDLAFQETSPAAVQRRVLQMLSPQSHSVADEYTCGNVLAAFQCLLPGETARAHRHTMNALRFMLEGRGAVTLVDGKECPMAFGDLVLTPGMAWHAHRHDGSEPVVWLDVLDVPLHMYLGTAVFQPGPMEPRPQTMRDEAYASPNIAPCVTLGDADRSPVFRYPYEDAVRALHYAPASRDGIRRVRYVNPLTGQGALPLLDTTMQELDAGMSSRPTRSNANLVVAVVEGQGESRVGDARFRWKARDVFTVPQHNWVTHTAFEGKARFFVVSDADVLRRLNLLAEDVREDF